MSRVLVSGSRDFPRSESLRVLEALRFYTQAGDGGVIVHGDARGLDTIAAVLADVLFCTEEPHPADWNKYGRAAGNIRNAEMADLGADVCVAFLVEGEPCKGTRNMIKLAVARGIPTFVYELKRTGELVPQCLPS